MKQVNKGPARTAPLPYPDREPTPPPPRPPLKVTDPRERFPGHLGQPTSRDSRPSPYGVEIPPFTPLHDAIASPLASHPPPASLGFPVSRPGDTKTPTSAYTSDFAAIDIPEIPNAQASLPDSRTPESRLRGPVPGSPIAERSVPFAQSPFAENHPRPMSVAEPVLTQRVRDVPVKRWWILLPITAIAAIAAAVLSIMNYTKLHKQRAKTLDSSPTFTSAAKETSFRVSGSMTSVNNPMSTTTTTTPTPTPTSTSTSTSTPIVISTTIIMTTTSTSDVPSTTPSTPSSTSSTVVTTPSSAGKKSTLATTSTTMDFPPLRTSKLDQRNPKDKKVGKICGTSGNSTMYYCTGDVGRVLPNMASSVLYLVGCLLLLGYFLFAFICGPVLHYYIQYSRKVKNKDAWVDTAKEVSPRMNDESVGHIGTNLLNNDGGHVKKTVKWITDKLKFWGKKRGEVHTLPYPTKRDIVVPRIDPTSGPTVTEYVTATTTATVTRTMTLSNSSGVTVNPSALPTVGSPSVPPISGAERLSGLPLLVWLLGGYRHRKHRTSVYHVPAFEDVGQAPLYCSTLPQTTAADQRDVPGTLTSTIRRLIDPGTHTADTKSDIEEPI
ncbi:hypothetical protein K491DRAFT_720795 [Lophiostoma macrostomum CBS 122681]|uniref:Uncharacterized protein n=1 Tax=Lophiostoma macrostomum CBS 122681 TaxID=1314788 RepID=A0A6A6SRR0_9PLEO|nr:hypothetical protein K491DRAFT_720795 [Lophiostoma macrostomum CBS 122681]